MYVKQIFLDHSKDDIELQLEFAHRDYQKKWREKKEKKEKTKANLLDSDEEQQEPAIKVNKEFASKYKERKKKEENGRSQKK